MERVDPHFVSPVAKFGISGPPIRPQKNEVVNLEECKCAEGGDAMVIFDYNEKMLENKYIAIEADTLCCVGAEVYHATFRNFPTLRIENLKLSDCVFENCKTVYFTDCEVSQCRFTTIETLYADNSPLFDCDFEHLGHSIPAKTCIGSSFQN